MKRKLTVEDELLTEGGVDITSTRANGHVSCAGSSLPWPCHRRHDQDASIVFVGPRATGTSSLAVIAGSILGWKIIDCDREFEKLTGSTKQQYRIRHGAESYRRRKLDVVEEVLEANTKRCVFACGTITSWEENRFSQRYAQKHPIVYVIRERKLIQNYLGLADEGGWNNAVEHMHFFFRQRSNYEFFNLDEAEEPQWQTTLTTFLQTKSQTLSQAPLVLRKTRAHVSILLCNIFGPTFQTKRYTDIQKSSKPGPRLRQGSNVLFIDLRDIKGNSKYLKSLDTGHDAVQLNITGPLHEWHSILSTDTLAWALASVRRQLDIPVIVNVLTSPDLGISPPSNQPKVYELLLHSILRLAPEYLTVDLRSPDQVISKIVQTKGLTQVIGYLHVARSLESFQQSGDVLSLCRRAHDLGCDVVNFCGFSTSLQDNYVCQQISQSILKLGLSTPTIVFNVGPFGRLSQVVNTLMTPVIPDGDVQEPREGSIAKLGLASARQLRIAWHMLVPPRRKQYYVFGAEVKQSLSPSLHNAGFKSCGLPFTYQHYESSDLSSIKEISSQGSFGGASISLPFKSQVLTLVTKQSPAVQLIGAANTILPLSNYSDSLKLGQDNLEDLDEPTLLMAENTDWMGIYGCIAKHCTPANHITKETAALVMGAGGIARAAIYALVQLGVGHIVILNRTYENALQVKEHFEHTCGDLQDSDAEEISSAQATYKPAFYVLKSCDEPWPLRARKPSVIVCAIPARATEPVPEYPPELPHDWFSNPTGGLIADPDHKHTNLTMASNNHRTPTKDLFSLSGKTIIVTGATGGIGLVVATALAESGASVVSIQIPNDPNSESLRHAIEGAGQSFQSFECDLLNAASIKGCFERVWAAGVVPDVLFHAAGVTHRSMIVDTTVETLTRVIDLNVKAAYLVCQSFAARMLKLGRKGKVITIASMAAELVQTNVSVYSCSKAFVKSMTRAMSNEWAGHGIQVNSISPGWIDAGMAKDLGDDPEFSKVVCARTSIGRWGTPDDLRGVVIFLASAASDFITGADILIDGGVLGR
ncbi:hypothetical protein H2204_009985 [Knufia peltigerae]|uniref:Ketoreductase domain-containing protein n=1 Tax=Knufia peltigerae TaxID=1002370 RepID=A0AA38XYA0_9EURO|nr:hypothetical protein H2204_009985 [Knufia peltigerae]